MKFIEKFKTLAGRRDNKGMRCLLQELANDGSVFSTRLEGFGSLSESQSLYFYFSDGEVAFMLVDADGSEGELADEEEFNGEAPLWFTERSHRVSPFAQLKALTLGFMETMRALGHGGIDDYLCILVSNTRIINYDDYISIFADSNGVVFHKVKDIDAKITCAPNNTKGQDMLDDFRSCCSLSESIHSLFAPFKHFLGESSNKSIDKTGRKTETVNAYDYIEKKDLDEFFALEDSDFKITEEAINPATGEKLTIKKDAELPPVTILQPLVNPGDLLNEMVGLKQLKTNISEMIAYARYSKKVKEAFPDYAHQSVSLHTIIIGNPGTGKTTICRIYGGLLHSAGVLSRGHTVVASRSSFIGQNFGTEELRMRQCIKLAQGGCLFIDEAGQLFSNPHPHDPGRGVIQLMLQLLAEEENRDIAVVLALYANDRSLERLYDLNPGIKSRFVNVLSFPDYSWSELIEIAHKKIKEQGLSFTPKAWHKFCDVLKRIYDGKGKNYGNAREVVNLIQKCVIKHAVRCERQNIIGESLLRITVHDIPEPQQTVIIQRPGFKYGD